MNENRVTILICNYNKPKELVFRCLQSILNQTYKNLEVLFVDNGSKNNLLSESDFEDFKKQIDLKIYFVSPNRGVGNGYNFILSKITTDLYIFVDSDDFLEKEAIEEMVTTKEKTGSDMVFVRHYLVYPDGHKEQNKFKGDTITLPGKQLIKSVLDWDHEYSNHIVSEDLGTHWGILFSKSTLHGDYLRPGNNYQIGLYEDFDYVIRCLSKVNNVTVLNRMLYNLNRGVASTSSHYVNIYSEEILIATKSIYCNICDFVDDETRNAFCHFFYSRFFLYFQSCNSLKDVQAKRREILNAAFSKWIKSYCNLSLKQRLKKYALFHSKRFLWMMIQRQKRKLS